MQPPTTIISNIKISSYIVEFVRKIIIFFRNLNKKKLRYKSDLIKTKIVVLSYLKTKSIYKIYKTVLQNFRNFLFLQKLFLAFFHC